MTIEQIAKYFRVLGNEATSISWSFVYLAILCQRFCTPGEGSRSFRHLVEMIPFEKDPKKLLYLA